MTGKFDFMGPGEEDEDPPFELSPYQTCWCGEHFVSQPCPYVRTCAVCDRWCQPSANVPAHWVHTSPQRIPPFHLAVPTKEN